jgi:FG-GAP repeat
MIMRSKRATHRAIRQQLMARASILALGVALQPRGWASGLLAVGLIGAQAPALAQETIDLASEADLIIQGAAAGDLSGGRSVSGAGDVDGDGIADLLIGARFADPNGRSYAGASYVVFGSGPVAALEELIADVEAADLPGGLENSLTKKLSSAQGSLARGQINAAIGKIQAFINQVEAQRGKKIPEADADAWIADAETILDMLSTS